PFLAAFLVLTVAYSAIFVGILDAGAQVDTIELQAAEAGRVGIAASSAEASIDAAASDVRVAAASRAVRSLIRGTTPETLASAASVFAAQVNNKPSILQTRFVDERGEEQLAVRRSQHGVERV